MTKIWRTRVLLIFLQLVALIVVLLAGKAAIWEKKALNPEAVNWSQSKNIPLQPSYNQATAPSQQVINPPVNSMSLPNYTPKYEVAWAHPTNYGERYTTDINGLPVNNQPIIVLHETVGSAKGVINFFQTPHANENEQVSYHTLIKLDGTVVYLVPPDKRAFGAGNSVFNGLNGSETVKTDPKFPPSVNNFAYHSAFETPPDGWNNKRNHSGYTEAQYRSLTWLVAQSDVPEARITTHRAVDRSGKRIDPRSFNFKKFLDLLGSYRQARAKESKTLSSTS